MGVRPGAQALQLLFAAALGLGEGLLYGLLTPLRRGSGRIAATLIDALFCALCAALGFVFAMRAPEGRMGVWELFMCLMGFVLYIRYGSNWLNAQIARDSAQNDKS